MIGVLALGDKLGVPITGDNRTLTILGHGIRVNQLKRDALLARDDADFNCDLERYKRIIAEEGFREVLRVPFVSVNPWDEKRDESLYIYFRDKGGVLLAFDTYYGEKSVNGGNFYYNWKPKNKDYEKYRVTSSGGWRFDCPPELEVSYEERYVDGVRQETPAIAEKDRKRRELFMEKAVWVGSHDCREAIRHNISKLEEFGEFLTPWQESPFLWLLHHMDTQSPEGKDLGYKSYDYEGITKSRIAQLPEDVRRAINEGKR